MIRKSCKGCKFDSKDPDTCTNPNDCLNGRTGYEPIDLDWQKAEDHLRFFMAEYAALPGGVGQFGLQLTLVPLFNRYQSGERTEELYNEMMEVE